MPAYQPPSKSAANSDYLTPSTAGETPFSDYVWSRLPPGDIRAPRRLVLGSGSTKLTLDKDAGKASLQRKLLFWNLKPTESLLSEFTSVTVDKAVDRASGVEIFHTMLVTRAGAAWAFPADDKSEAEKNMAALREFLALRS